MGSQSRGIAEVSQTHILDITFTGIFTTYGETRHSFIIFLMIQCFLVIINGCILLPVHKYINFIGFCKNEFSIFQDMNVFAPSRCNKVRAELKLQMCCSA